MTHFTDEELVDLTDGALPADRLVHLQGCARCQTRAGELEWALARALEGAVPEPSPLFWDHLSARIRDAVAAPEIATGRDRGWGPRRAWAAGLAVVTFTVAAAVATPFLRPDAASQRVVVAKLPADGARVPAEDPPADDIGVDEAWAAVLSAADRVEWENTREAGIGPGPGAADGMTLELSSREQSALADLLERELERAGT